MAQFGVSFGILQSVTVTERNNWHVHPFFHPFLASEKETAFCSDHPTCDDPPGAAPECGRQAHPERPMQSLSYNPLLIAVLRRTLDQIEDEAGTTHDAALLELKGAILRILARIERPKSQPEG